MGEPDPVTIRLAGPDDIDALARVSRLAFRATYPGIIPDAVLDEWT